MKKITPLIILFFTLFSYSQKNTDYTFGQVTNEEINLTKYLKDTTANALVLYESGNTIFKIDYNKIIISTTYYTKIKIFNQEGFDNGTFTIPLYKSKSKEEKAINIEAITHNNVNKTYLAKSQIFEERVSEKWSEVKFTMPNLKDGSIVEVKYTVETPFIFNLTGWQFQSNIPKLFSQYKASIPGNYIYNRQLKGYLRLKTNSSTVKKGCFRVPGYAGDANCEEITYEMENIPAFQEEEYMTDKDNFISKIKFELAETLWFDGSKKKYTTTWEAVDKEFRTDKNIGHQLKKTKYFEDLIPAEIKNMEAPLERAKSVYTFIQNYFSWNGKYGIFDKVSLKNAIDKKTGNVGEINISLINAFKSVGLNAELVLLSTRNNGFATKIYPVITDFNYIIAKVNIDQKSYLIDATDKLIPFGLLPFKCLNGYGRVMDFENESYWLDILPDPTSKNVLNSILVLNEDGTISGKLRNVNYTYNALTRREHILNKSEDDIISEFENQFNNLEVTDYQIDNLNNIDKPVIETFDILIPNEENANTLYISPFFAEQLKKNPFKQENRLYPVDFGYPKKNIVTFSLEIPNNFEDESFPNPTKLVLEQNAGTYSLNVRNQENFKISFNSLLKVNKPLFYSAEYEPLKRLFKETINTQKKPIVLKKKEITMSK